MGPWGEGVMLTHLNLVSNCAAYACDLDLGRGLHSSTSQLNLSRF